MSKRGQQNQGLTIEIQRIHLKSKACSTLDEKGWNSFNYEEKISALSIKRKGCAAE